MSELWIPAPGREAAMRRQIAMLYMLCFCPWGAVFLGSMCEYRGERLLGPETI